MTDWSSAGFETRAIHAGQEPDPRTGAVVPPVYQVSTYAQDGVGGLREGYEYSRSGNPTRHALEECLASLEHGARGLAFASGLAAEDTLLRAVTKPGDHAIIGNDAYGGTYRLFARVAAPWGLEHTPVDLTDLDAVRAAVRPGVTRIVWAETPTNPLLTVVDIAALAEIAHESGAILVVDNTFASPYLQQPLLLGADVVVHSTTKYLGGHSDVIGGGLVVSDGELGEQLAYHQNAMGSVPGPWDSWLVLRGIKTLGVRMDRHCANARDIVDVLTRHSRVVEVLYPGLPGHRGYDVAQRQMRNFGGMVSFRVAGGVDAAVDLCGRTRVFTLGESLGGVESLIEHPGRMTHASAAGSPLEVPDDLVRLSVGIESSADLVADLEEALE
ncbi:MAG: cystathionine gamma-synthase [Candidatus Nanopelagicales bacterium]|jgi:cystathionine gamma-synthase|nr:cystathionine gamma-synthase [Candidatus Nanopelagicales bacterium]MDP4714886.1 cystathionine gamma-synthase [Candidatus Nanopelagicales bacterium]MDP4907224.1 cystathionine gamma-synthase [Candidatus Nanopelagicales bacterium]MDP4975764.1 cystathionine gamma-synthase [Candidatus Nanopelagicales bacterium]MDP5094769.1 cystathionine gamma-synthase [Candidatus Nanopelagicales bacterium]